MLTVLLVAKCVTGLSWIFCNSLFISGAWGGGGDGGCAALCGAIGLRYLLLRNFWPLVPGTHLWGAGTGVFHSLKNVLYYIVSFVLLVVNQTVGKLCKVPK